MPPYNGGLFKDAGSHEFLGTHRVSDRHLAPALDELSRQEVEDGERRFVDYGFIGVRELGSVYEGLLEFSLRIADEDLVVVKEKGKEVYVPKGSQKRMKVLGSVKKGDPYLVNDKKERKATGAYYTPRYIVDYIVRNTLGPLVEERREALEARLAEVAREDLSLKRGRKSEEYRAERRREAGALRTLLDVNVLDPAMGSGHFLVAAVDYLTDEFSRIISELDAEPVVEELAELRAEIRASLEAYGASATDEQLSDANLLKRMVLKRCVYGVDLNEMAVELAKLSLWLDAFTVGAPLSFLDHHLKHGNSLIGSSVREVRREVETSGSLLGNQFTATLIQGTELMQHVGEIPDATEGEVRESIDAYAQADKVLAPYKRMLDIWTSQHFGNGQAERFLSMTVSTGDVDHLTKGDYTHFARRDRETIGRAIRLSDDQHFFHWELEFPEVFYEAARERENAGFDAVVGNPPYVSAWSMTEMDANIRASIAASIQTKDVLSGHWDLYLPFLLAAHNLCRGSGRFSFIIPNPFSREKYAAAARKFLLEHTRLEHILAFGKENVFEEVSRQTLVPVFAKTVPDLESAQVRIDDPTLLTSTVSQPDSERRSVRQAMFLELPGYQIRHELTPKELAVLKKIDTLSVRLGEICYVNYGAQVSSKKKGEFSKSDVVSTSRVGNAKRFFDGKDISRYRISWSGRYLDYRLKEMYGPRAPELFESSKIVIRDFTGADERLVVAYDDSALYCDHLIICATHYDNVENAALKIKFKGFERIAKPYPSLLYLTGLLASKLVSWYFWRSYATDTLQGSYSHTYPQQIRDFPVRRVALTTPLGERELLLAKGEQIYNESSAEGNYARVLDFVNTYLPDDMNSSPNISDDCSHIVHDFIAYLVEEKIAMHKHQMKVEGAWQEWVETILPPNHKLTKTFLDQGWVEVGIKKGWEGVKAEFQARKAIPSGKALQDLRRETEEALEELRPLYERIHKTDELIDQIVYRLYGLTEEEISVVEASVERG